VAIGSSVMGHLLLPPLSTDAVRRWRGDNGQERTFCKLSSYSRCSLLAQVKMNLHSGVMKAGCPAIPSNIFGQILIYFLSLLFAPEKHLALLKDIQGVLVIQ
jgi:hypothetical protein